MAPAADSKQAAGCDPNAVASVWALVTTCTMNFNTDSGCNRISGPDMVLLRSLGHVDTWSQVVMKASQVAMVPISTWTQVTIKTGESAQPTMVTGVMSISTDQGCSWTLS